MQKLISFILIFMMAGCSFPGVYKINVQQGNIVTEEEISQLAEGMPRRQVHAVLGTPLLINPTDMSREYFVYTFQREGGDIRKQQVVVHYNSDNQLARYETELLAETPAY
ncbi:outer membrane protein assembly factor BamE [Marinobacter sp. F4216]|uniref:outer membrane protein assembly factor BamE n=1 Tax=Marinobacter sp. F4216 TaxID=2874281 RepID=UPI001CBC9A1C|nr:outer membrane protein assembly factor BamE [Marinobacter sp. F4216]MBZ2169027.1 outer membrane protein assembly factor BamE [Marinobacter sp. F4216]